MEGKLKKVKVVAVGDHEVGKTWFLVAFTNSPGTDVGTIVSYASRRYFDNDGHRITVDGKEYDLSVWEAVTMEEYDRLRKLIYAETDVFLVCFSIDSTQSLANIKDRWTPEIRQYCPGVPVVLVGMKKDLRSTSRDRDSLISEETASLVQNEIGAVGYHEASAVTKEGVQVAMEAAVRAAMSTKTTSKRRGFRFPWRK